MKTFVILFLSLLICLNSSAQIPLNENFKMVSNQKFKSLTDFVNYHKIDYALVVWYTSNWIASFDVYSCLFRKGDKWSLVEIKDDASKAVGFPYKLFIKQKALNTNGSDSLLNVLKIDSAFRYKQSDFDNLPEICEYKKDGKMQGMYGIMDAATTYLVQIKAGKTDVLTFYAANQYLESCYPYVPKFGIFKRLC
jgi:hypothetical protein